MIEMIELMMMMMMMMMVPFHIVARDRDSILDHCLLFFLVVVAVSVLLDDALWMRHGVHRVHRNGLSDVLMSTEVKSVLSTEVKSVLSTATATATATEQHGEDLRKRDDEDGP